MKSLLHSLVLLLLSFTLAACFGSGGGGGSSAVTYTVGGTVTGLEGTGLVLQNNSADDLSIDSNGDFTFATVITDGLNYNISVLTQPTGQVCPITNGSGTLSGADVTDITVTCMTPLGDVTALYSANGSDWNNYVTDDGASFAQATDTACIAASDTACLHGGEIRFYEVSALSSCTGIMASDALGAFDWSCDDSTGTVRLISTGLKKGKGLADLIDFSVPGWKKNSLTVYEGAEASSVSLSTNWWSNPLAVDNDGGSLDTAGIIYVVTNDALDAGYIINASSVALVGQPGLVINGPGGGASSYVISADGSLGEARDFLWVEGTVDAAGDNKGVYWHTVRFSALRNITADSADTGTQPTGIYLQDSSNNTLSGVTANNNSSTGVGLNYSSGNTLSEVTASNNKLGVYLSTSSNNTITRVTASNNNFDGIVLLTSSSNNTLSHMIASNNGVYGVRLHSGAAPWDTPNENNTLLDVTASNNENGIYLYYSYGSTLSGVTVLNNNYYGIMLEMSYSNTLKEVAAINNYYGIILKGFLLGTDNHTLGNILATNNTYGIRIYDSLGNYFTGLLKVGFNGVNCSVSGWPEPGILHGSCENNGPSNATLITGVTASGSYIAKVTADDGINTSDTDGAAIITDLTLPFDWTNFENPYRAWGRNGSVFPDTTNRDRLGCSDRTYTNQTDCETNSFIWTGDARIWDWSLLATDTVIKDVLTLPTGNGTLTHTWSDASTSTVLRNAVEIQGDSIGNDDTLCETDETCLFMPNIGSYQGHGNLISAGAFTDGTITGVTLIKYESNGY